MIYRLILKARHARYKEGKRSTKAEVPTICVGNITVGGTGKTPHTEMILRTLMQSREWGARNLAVLSRGYKRSSKGFQTVLTDSTADFCGDEPLQIKRKFPAVTVAVDRDRVEGCDFLVHPEHEAEAAKGRKGASGASRLPAELVILDDAYQYRKLKADLDIVLVDWSRPVTRDSLLPYGRLRDLPERLYDADVVIISKCPYELDASEKKAVLGTLGYHDYDPAACTAAGPAGRSQTVLFTRVVYESLKPVFQTTDPHYIYAKKMILFTGIAKGAPLCNYLSDTYKVVNHIVFSDHHRYTRADIRRISKAVRRNPTAVIATTEKDAQRIMDMSKLPQKLRDRMFCLPIRAEFISDQETELFTRMITQL